MEQELVGTPRTIRRVAYLSIGETKGKKRIWIQGERLLSIGLAPGERFHVRYDHAQKAIRIRAAEAGRRVCAKKQGRRIVPLIDLNNSEIGALFKDVRRVRAEFLDGQILITIHPDDLRRKERFERFMTKLRTGQSLAAGSLAHGAGIMDHALHEGLKESAIAVELVIGVEIDGEALKCSLRNNPIWAENALAIEGPMQHVEAALMPPLDIMTSGLPCVGSSKAGRTKSKLKHAEQHPSAGALFTAFLTLLKAANPAIALIENVPSFAQSASACVLRTTLKEWGYQIHEAVLNGNTFGALENRERFILIALTEGLTFSMQNIVPARTKEPCVQDILDPMADDDPRWRPYLYLRDKEKRDILEGKGFKMQIIDPGQSWIPTLRRGYHRTGSTDPLLPHPSDATLFRKFTAAEHARAKAIAFALVAGHSETLQHELLGQSVIYPMFQAIGQALGRMCRKLMAPRTAPPQANPGRICWEVPAWAQSKKVFG